MSEHRPHAGRTDITDGTYSPIKLTGYKKKTGEPYEISVGHWHVKILAAMRDGSDFTDAELTFALHKHMLMARRCELRDLGFVHQTDSRDGAGAWGITSKGRDWYDQISALGLVLP